MKSYRVTLRYSHGPTTTITIFADSLYLAQQEAKAMFSDATILRVVPEY